MLFCVMAKCSSLREVSGAMLGLSGKTQHFRLESLPYRSTLSDANARRGSEVFEQIYYNLKCSGRNPTNGKRKGGIKMHTIINVDETVPKVVWFTSAATNDHLLLDKLELSPDKIYVFDKGYNDYKAFAKFTENSTGFVTRIKDNAVYKTLENNKIEAYIHSGVIEDTIIT